MEMTNMLAAGLELEGGVKTVVLTVVWLVAIGIGVFEYARSKGRIGRALGATLGGGLLLTFVVNPSILTEDVPTIFGNVIEWMTKAGKKS